MSLTETFESTTPWVFAITICLFDYFLLAPIQYFNVKKFIHDSDENVLLKRGYPNIIKLFNMSSMYQIVISKLHSSPVGLIQ